MGELKERLREKVDTMGVMQDRLNALQHTRGKAFDSLDTNQDRVIDRSEFDAATAIGHSSSRKGSVTDLRRLLSDKVESMGALAENGILRVVEDTSADGEIVARVVAVIGDLITFAGERADAVGVLQGKLDTGKALRESSAETVELLQTKLSNLQLELRRKEKSVGMLQGELHLVEQTHNDTVDGEVAELERKVAVLKDQLSEKERIVEESHL